MLILKYETYTMTRNQSKEGLIITTFDIVTTPSFCF